MLNWILTEYDDWYIWVRYNQNILSYPAISQFAEKLKNHIFVISGFVFEPFSFIFEYDIKLGDFYILNHRKRQKKKKKKVLPPGPHPYFCPNDLKWSGALDRSATTTEAISAKILGV